MPVPIANSKVDDLVDLETNAEVRDAYLDALIQAIANCPQKSTLGLSDAMIDVLESYKTNEAISMEKVVESLDEVARQLGEWEKYTEGLLAAHIKQAHNRFFKSQNLLFKLVENPLTMDLVQEKLFIKDLGKLAIISQDLNSFFHKKFNQAVQVLMKPLIENVVYGREQDVKALLAKNPELLFKRGSCVSEMGVEHTNETPYEAALRCGDTQMCEMLQEFFNIFENGEEERLRQYKNVFPEGADSVINAQKSYDFEWLIIVINRANEDDVQAQLNHQQNNSLLCQAFNLFRKEFAALSKQEKHANLKHLSEAFRAYAKDSRILQWNERRKKTYNEDKLDLFWRQVIGFVQLYLRECDKQVLHQSLYDINDKKEPLKRLAEFKYDEGFSLHCTSDYSGAGFKFASRSMCRELGLPRGDAALWVDYCWKIYLEQKTAILQNLSRSEGRENEYQLA